MIKVVVGDLLESKAQTLVNTVNCVGIMGKGLALQFKTLFPDMYADYVRRCEAHEVVLGKPYLFRPLMPPWILNFPTKGHWKAQSRLSDIVAGLEYIQLHYHAWGIESLAVPPLGCGFGQLDWNVVGPTLYRHLSRLDIPIELYAPPDTPTEELDTTFLDGSSLSVPSLAPSYEPSDKPKIDPNWVVLVEMLVRESNRQGSRPVSKSQFQAISYFADISGISTGLHFTLGKRGVQSPEFQKLLARLINNGLCKRVPSGKHWALTHGPTYGDAVETFFDKITTHFSSIDRVAKLLKVFGPKTQLLANIHFVATQIMVRHPELTNELVEEQLGMANYGRRLALNTDSPCHNEIRAMMRYLRENGWLESLNHEYSEASPRTVPVLSSPTLPL